VSSFGSVAGTNPMASKTSTDEADNVVLFNSSEEYGILLPDFRRALQLPITAKANTDSPYAIADQDLVVCDLSSGDIELDLPASPATNFVFGVYVGTEGATSTTKHKVTVDGNGNDLGGSSDVLMFVEADCLVCRYNGSQWLILSQHLAAHSAGMRQTSAQTLNNNTLTQVTWDEAVGSDIGSLVNLAGNKFVVQRAGSYDLEVFANIDTALTSGEKFDCELYINDVFSALRRINYSGGGFSAGHFDFHIPSLAAGDTVDARLKQNSGAAADLLVTSGGNALASIKEIM